MAAFEWLDEYSVGDATIDAQHQKIVGILNDLQESLGDGKVDDRAVASAIFDRLAEYVMSHFSYEEQRMAESDYPPERVAEHRQVHNRMLAEVQKIMALWEQGDDAAMAELLPYLYGDWLIGHICTVDHDYAPYLKGR